MRRILLDTNFIIDMVKWKIDLFPELKRICDFAFQVFVPDVVWDELKAFPPRSKEGQCVKVAQLILDKKSITIMTKGGLADDVLVRMTARKDIVATQDQALKRRLRANSVGIITIREKGYLQLIDRVMTYSSR
jgi:rRNA-processing protein FCF1